MTLFELTKSLLDKPSVTGEEGALADFITEYLTSQGFTVKPQPVEAERKNILATTGSAPKVILCTHMDTVPPYFTASEDQEYIYGRGACDAKGILAAMIWAARNLKEQAIRDFGLLFLIGEETDSIGAKTANAMNLGSDYIIVGEPTENKLGIGHKGIVILNIVTRGKAAHSAYSELGESALLKMLDIMQQLRALEFTPHPVLGNTTINIGTLESGAAANTVPDVAHAGISIRSPLSTKQILEEIRTVVNDGAEIEIVTRSEPQTLFHLSGFDEVVLPYGTDIPHLKSFGKPLLIGPGSAAVMHTENERIEKRQLIEAVAIYEELVKRLLT